MCGNWGFRRIAALVLVAVSAAAGAASAQPEATSVRLGEHPGMTRFVLELTAPVEFTVFTLARPYRVVIDLPEIGWRLPAEAGGKGKGLVSGFRYGLFKPGTSRIVLDVTDPVNIKGAYIIAPDNIAVHRFVLDLEQISPEAFEKQSRLRALAAPSPAKPSENASRDETQLQRRVPGDKRIIAVDPGHGGVDPGAIGTRGTFEKNITIAIAKELKRALGATRRYQVVLTREADVFVRLRERIAQARAAGAELFVSLHADSLENRKVHGASVYTLSETASDKEAATLAAKENKADIIAGVDLSNESSEVTNILIDLAQRESMNEATHFANMLIGELGGITKIIRNTHRFAGFAVLKAPDIPSVLVEMGYLSNRAEEKKLRSKSYRAKIAAAIQRAIDAYFARQDALTRS